MGNASEINGHTVSFTYDNQGRTKTATHSDSTVLSYIYTGDGQLHSVTETKGEKTIVVTSIPPEIN